MVRLQTLGVIDLRDGDGRPLRSVLAQPKRLALLVYLALEREPCRRDTLLGLFWPESSEERARHSLNQGLYALRRTLGEKALTSRGAHEVGIDPVRVWCDANQLLHAADGGRLEEALELYRDDFLKGFFLDGAPAFEHWVDATRDRLRDCATRCAWALAIREEAAGNAGGAAHWGRRAVALSRDDEALFRELVQLLARTGQASVAVREFESFERRLREEFELEPDPATRTLIDGLRQRPEIRSASDPGDGGRPAPTFPAPAATGGVLHASGAGSRTSAAPPVAAGATAPLATSLAIDALTPFVGRERELGRLIEMVVDPAERMVTIVGTAGSGKTRLSLRAATGAATSFADGVVFVPLSSVPAPERIATAIAGALPLRPDGSPLERQVLGFLRDRQLLLVLDNMDHLLDGSAALADMLATAPGLTLLVTSREALNLRGERLFPLTGMKRPADPESHDFDASESVRLFLEAAGRVQPDIVLDAEDRRRLTELLELVEGLPLGIELAAAWTGVLSLDAIVAELRCNRLALANPMRDAPQRHASLEVALDYSWQHLTESQRGAAESLSVFRAGFTREAALEVAGASLDILKSLLDKSLLQRRPDHRYVMLEVIREYAAGRLARDPAERAQGRDRHRDHYARFLYDRLDGLRHAEDAVLREIESEAPDLLEAWDRAIETFHAPALEAALEPLFIFFDAYGRYAEGADALRRASDRSPDNRPALLARLLSREGALRLRAGELERSRGLLARALELARSAGEVSETGFILDRLGVVLYQLGDFGEAKRLQEESLRLRESVADRAGVATSLNNLGSLAYATGEYEEAQGLFERSLAIQREIRDDSGIILSLHNLGITALVLGRHGEALGHLEDALGAAASTGSTVLVARSLHQLGNAAHAAGRSEDACRYLERALAAAGVVSTPLALEILFGLAGPLRRLDRRPRAAAILAFVGRHPAAEQARRDAAARLLAEIATEMPAAEFEDCLARARALTLTDLLRESTGAAAASDSSAAAAE